MLESFGTIGRSVVCATMSLRDVASFSAAINLSPGRVGVFTDAIQGKHLHAGFTSIIAEYKQRIRKNPKNKSSCMRKELFLPIHSSLIRNRLSAFVACGVAGLTLANSLQAQVIVNEDFESYADTAAMDAKWDNVGTGLGVLVNTNGFTGNSAYHPGGAVNQWKGSTFSIAPSATHNIVLRGDIFNVSGTDGRQTIGLRVGTDIFEMGHYNAAPVLQQFGIRVNSIYSGGGTGGYLGFDNATETLGWNRFEAVFTLTEVTVTLDLGIDGTIDHTIVSSGLPGFTAFTDLRFGGPSGNTSAEPAWYDNIYLAVVPVPEPASGAMLGLGLAAFVGLRRMRK